MARTVGRNVFVHDALGHSHRLLAGQECPAELEKFITNEKVWESLNEDEPGYVQLIKRDVERLRPVVSDVPAKNASAEAWAEYLQKQMPDAELEGDEKRADLIAFCEQHGIPTK